MDSLTHTVLGACVGQVLAGKKIGKKAMLWGALANNLPDIDVLSSFLLSQASGLLAHRGFTHSILFAIIISPILAFLLHRKYRSTAMTFMDWLLIFGTGNLIHIGIDALTCYGTGWFEPFSHHRVTFNVLFVADPFFTIASLISSIALMIISKHSLNRNKWAKGAIIICCLYVVYAITNKFTMDRKMEAELQRQNLPYKEFFATPTPLNNWLWYMIAKNDSGFYIGYRSLFDRKSEIAFNYYPQHKELLDQFKSNSEVDKLKRFSKGYYTAEAMDSSVYFSDIRFGQIGGWESETAPFVFRYSLGENANNDLVIQKGRIAMSGKEAIHSLIKRIRGINH